MKNNFKHDPASTYKAMGRLIFLAGSIKILDTVGKNKQVWACNKPAWNFLPDTSSPDTCKNRWFGYASLEWFKLEAHHFKQIFSVMGLFNFI